MSRINARNSIGEAVDQILLATPDLQTIKDKLATGYLEGISSGPLDLTHLGPLGLTLADVFQNTPTKLLYDQAFDPLLRRDLHERRMGYSQVYAELIKELVKV